LLTPPLLEYVARFVHTVLRWCHQVFLAGVGRAHCASCCLQSWKTSYMWHATTADGTARIRIVFGLRRRRRQYCLRLSFRVEMRMAWCIGMAQVQVEYTRIYRNMTYLYTIILCFFFFFYIDSDGCCCSDESDSLQVGGNCARRVFHGLALQIILGVIL
jgi:hypothetical protein